MKQIQRMNISTSLNSKYMRYTYVMLMSLFENQPRELEIHIYILQSDLTNHDKIYLKNLVDSYGGIMHFIEIDRNMFPEKCPTTKEWSLETYYRLALLDVLPEDVDRLLYLDVDIIVNKSLQEIYFTEFGNNMICACPDLSCLELQDARKDIFKEYFAKGMTYFNAGVMLFNIKEMRNKYNFDAYMKIAEKLDYKMVAPDQDILNYAHWNEVTLLEANMYNLFARLAYNYEIHYEEVKEQVTIVHFPGDKPWNGSSVHYDIEQLWWDYAKRTPFYVELMEEFIVKSINDSTIYDVMNNLSNEKRILKEELDKSVELCQRLVKMIG